MVVMVMATLHLPLCCGGLLILIISSTRISAFHTPVFRPLHHHQQQQIAQNNNRYRNNGLHRQSTALNNYIDTSENAQRDMNGMQGEHKVDLGILVAAVLWVVQIMQMILCFHLINPTLYYLQLVSYL